MKQGKFLESYGLLATALELAEGFPERLHQEIRDGWGFPDATDFTMRDRFGQSIKDNASHLAIRVVQI